MGARIAERRCCGCLVAMAIPLIAFFVFYTGFIFLRDSDAPKWVITLVAIVWGVGGVAVLFWIFNWLVELLPDTWKGRLQPFVFVGPAIAILTWYLAFPVARTFYISLFDRNGPEFGQFVGLANYVTIFTDRLMREAFRNNIFLWILFGVPLTVGFGLMIATLADRSKFERLSKALIFLPMAISFVGASVIWNFIYEVRPSDAPQIGLLNAIVVAIGRHTAGLACIYRHQPVEQSLSGRDRGLAADRLCHGALLCCPQRYSRRNSGGSPRGRRQRNPGLLPHYDPDHSWARSSR